MQPPSASEQKMCKKAEILSTKKIQHRNEHINLLNLDTTSETHVMHSGTAEMIGQRIEHQWTVMMINCYKSHLWTENTKRSLVPASQM